jgi:hypothetical protein
MTISSIVVASVYLVEFRESYVSPSQKTSLKALIIFFSYATFCIAEAAMGMHYYFKAEPAITPMPVVAVAKAD